MSLPAWMTYALATATLLTAAAWLLAGALRRLRLPTRGVWLAALLLSVALPVVVWLNPPEGPAPALPTPAAVVVAAGEPISLSPAADAGVGVLASLGLLVGSVVEAVDDLVARMATSASGHPTLGRWLAVGWLTASLLLFVTVGASMRRLMREARSWPRTELGGRSVRITPDLGPATLGILRPSIVIPRWVSRLDVADLELVLAHEEEHVRRRDPLVLALGVIPLLACPWNPLLWWQLRRLKEAVELDCDQRVLGRGAAPSVYGDLLLRLGTRASASVLPVPTMIGSPSLLERRLASMRNVSFLHALPAASAATLAGLAVLALACTTEAPSATDASLSVAPPTEHVFVIEVDQAGNVSVDGVAIPMEAVAAAAARVATRSDLPPVATIRTAPATPTRIVFEIQRALQEARVHRVIFEVAQKVGEDRRTALVLPEAEAQPPEQVSQRNLLHLTVQPDGAVEVRRGASQQAQMLRPAEVETLWRNEVQSNPRLIAAVKLHPEAIYSDMVAVLEALHAARAERISLQETPAPQPQAQVRFPSLEQLQRSLGGSVAPLIFVDGVEVDGGSASSKLEDLGPERVESVEVIKGPAAVARLGPRAAGGIIWIELKPGAELERPAEGAGRAR